MKDESIKVMVARIDERVISIDKRMDNFVTKDEFKPVKRIVNTVALALLTSVIGAVTWFKR